MNENIQRIKGIFSGQALRAVYRWSKPVHGVIALISVIGMLNSLISLAVTLVTKNLIDGATGGVESALWTWGIVLVVLIGGNRLLGVRAAFLRVKAATDLQKHLQGMVTSSMMSKEYPALKHFHSGELVSRVFSDVSVVKSGVLNLLPSLLQMSVSFIGAAVILITMDWRFLPALILAAVLGGVIAVLFREPMKRRHKRMQEAEAKLHASTQETLENMRLIKASVSEERALETMDGHREHLADEQIRNGKLSVLFNNGMGVAFDISWLLCNLWGCVKIFHRTFTYGSLAALIQLIGRIQSPIANAVNLISRMYGVTASAERLLEVVGLPDEKTGEQLGDFDEIRLDKVSFQYKESREDVLNDLNVKIRKGDFVALTGISGGGKTSLFQLLLGIYKPTNGSVLFVSGGKEVPAAKGTRGLFAYVPQGNTLMSGTLRDNLTMFADHATEEEIAAAVHAACLDDLIAEIGMDARIGERGVGLSEGQAQRVAVARALLSNTKILLLDEATSALDEQTEAKLLENIDAMRDKTVLIVTHRRAALAICDYTLNIENGRMTRIEGMKE